jgi:hypothetical protein
LYDKPADSIVASSFLYGNNCGQRRGMVVVEGALMAGFQVGFKSPTELGRFLSRCE